MVVETRWIEEGGEWKEIEEREKGRREGKGKERLELALSSQTHLDLLNLTLQPSNIRITLRRGLIQLHHRHHRVHIVREDSDDGVGLVVEEDGAPWLEEILVDERHDRDVVLWSVGGRDDGVVVVDDLLEGTDGHGRTSKLVDGGSFFGRLGLGGSGLEEGLVGDVLWWEEK